MINARFQLRRAVAAEWTSVNPVLAAGEPGVELDTGYEKIGNGSSRWNDLPYTKGGAVDVAIKEEGTTVISTIAALNFVGASVTVTDGGSGVAIVTITDATLTTEQVQDIVGGLIGDSSVLDATYDDAGNALTITIKPGSVSASMLDFDVATQAELDAAVAAAVAALVNAAPSTLDTLGEISTALGNDPNLSTTLTNLIAAKIASAGHTANSVLTADGSGNATDVAVAASRIFGRLAIGGIAAMTTAELAALFGTPTGSKFLADDGTLKTASGVADWTIVGNTPTSHTTTGVGGTTVREDITLTGNATLTISLSNNQQAELQLHQDVTGSRTVTWVGVDVWATSGGAAPTLATAANASDNLYFARINGVTYGFFNTEPAGGFLAWDVRGNLGASATVTAADGQVVRVKGTLNANTAITIATSANQQAELQLVQDGTGSRAPTFSGVDVWMTQNGGAPSLAARTSGAVDDFQFEDIGGTCYGFWLTETITTTVAADPWLPTGAVAEAYSRRGAAVGPQVNPASGTLFLVGIPVQAGQVISSATFCTGSTALSGGSNQHFSLWDASLNKLVATADDTSTAWAASSSKTLAFTAPYTVPSGVTKLYVGIVVVATGMPTFMGVSLGGIGTLGITPKTFGSSSTGLTNPASLPTTAAAIANSSSYLYCYVS